MLDLFKNLQKSANVLKHVVTCTHICQWIKPLHPIYSQAYSQDRFRTSLKMGVPQGQHGLTSFANIFLIQIPKSWGVI